MTKPEKTSRLTGATLMTQMRKLRKRIQLATWEAWEI
jgi:hypothetical protein